MGYVHYFANNSIAAVVIDGTGVGEFRAAHIEAENYMRIAGGGARKLHLPERNDAFVVEVVSADAAALHYPHVVGAGARLALIAANAGPHSATVVARRGAADGAELARCSVEPSGGDFSRTTCRLALAASDEADLDLVLTFEAHETGAQLALQIDSLALVE